MEKLKQSAAEVLRSFHLPHYDQLPTVGLYLEQTVKYVNQCLTPLGCIELTSSMVRNYVKMGLISKPIQKQYYADHIAHLIPVTILKQVLPLDKINQLFERQRAIYQDEVAYNYFCADMENILCYMLDLKGSMEKIGQTQSAEKEILHCSLIAVAHIIFVNACLDQLKSEETTKKEGKA